MVLAQPQPGGLHARSRGHSPLSLIKRVAAPPGSPSGSSVPLCSLPLGPAEGGLLLALTGARRGLASR